MGTRADFYVDRGKKAEWLGSIAFDGYPDGISKAILSAKTEKKFRASVKRFFKEHDDVTIPENGWPWPWNDSNLTDYAYAFDDGVWYTIRYEPSFWWKAADGEPPDEDTDEWLAKKKKLKIAEFPDMSSIKNVRLDKGSGLIVMKS